MLSPEVPRYTQGGRIIHSGAERDPPKSFLVSYPARSARFLRAFSGGCLKILRDDSGFVIRGERFVSYQEVQCFRYLQWLGLAHEEMNHEYQVGRCSFDFFPLGKVFWEHHPICARIGEDLFQYGKRRRLTLNVFGYSGVLLVVSDAMFEDQWEVCDLMNDYDVDFKRGKVKGDPTICFVRNYGEEYDTSFYNESYKEAANLIFPIGTPLVGDD